MNKNINLLPQKNKNVLRHEHLLKIFNTTGMVLLIVVFIFTAVLFFLNRASPVVALEEKKLNSLRKLSESGEKVGKYLFVENRLNDVSDILNKRAHIEKTIDTIKNEVPEDVVIDSISIDKESVGISVNSKSLSSVNTFLDNLSGLVMDQKIFDNFILNSLVLDKANSKYVLSINLTF